MGCYKQCHSVHSQRKRYKRSSHSALDLEWLNLQIPLPVRCCCPSLCIPQTKRLIALKVSKNGSPAPPPILSFPFHPFRLHAQQDAGQRQKTFIICRIKILPTALSQCNRCKSWKPWAMILTWNMLLFFVKTANGLDNKSNQNQSSEFVLAPPLSLPT